MLLHTVTRRAVASAATFPAIVQPQQFRRLLASSPTPHATSGITCSAQQPRRCFQTLSSFLHEDENISSKVARGLHTSCTPNGFGSAGLAARRTNFASGSMIGCPLAMLKLHSAGNVVEDLSDAASDFTAANIDLTVYFAIAAGGRGQQQTAGGKTISRGVPANVGEATAASHFTTAAPSPSPPSAEAATTEETEDGPRVFRWNYRKGATAGLNAAGGATSYETLAEKYGRRKPRQPRPNAKSSSSLDAATPPSPPPPPPPPFQRRSTKIVVLGNGGVHAMEREGCSVSPILHSLKHCLPSRIQPTCDPMHADSCVKSYVTPRASKDELVTAVGVGAAEAGLGLGYGGEEYVHVDAARFKMGRTIR